MKRGKALVKVLAILCAGLAAGALITLACVSKHLDNKGVRDALPEYEYTLAKTVRVDGRQGIATDGRNYWVSGTTSLIKYDKHWQKVAENTTPFAGREHDMNHFGDIDVYNNELYVSAEYFMDGVGKNIQIAIYDADTLKFKRAFAFQKKSGQKECSGITVNPDKKRILLCSWVGGESGRYLYEYSLETGRYLRKIHLQCPPQWLQGLVYSKGAYYLTADDGTADKKEADHIYRVKIRDGATNAAVIREKTMDEVKFQGEIEGLTVNRKTGQLMVLYNRGSRIVLGMVKGFYPGYSREISEIYIFDRK